MRIDRGRAHPGGQGIGIQLMFGPILQRYATRLDQQGAVALEFAIFTPVIIMITLGIINFAELTNYRIELNRAIRAAANVAVISPPAIGDTAGIQQAFEFTAPANANASRQLTINRHCECPSGAAIACNSGCPDGDRRVLVQVHVIENYALRVPMPILGKTLSITDSITVRVS